ncbi:muramoyltetrapeptide carboxypeptidase [Noviherbaspirillum sp. UKPF54]|uniref:muramoyltetrapeptide carboxypeptidase n=1 Tax=Noviherbaspirillum sp. UKPF54 TaxID=2601898 RepID=UPI0011B0F4D9|nr:muramoyltetrapeptide carboxypeptidase [Noviherbaspirillum sp. UKPF54]QDZ27628.1 muramoyltetrapeptide carboxypeptidase [Noviherbaspirillum sp. UKPF54]
MTSTLKVPAGTGVAIVAPGGYAPDEVALGRAIERLQAQGCLVRNYYDPLQKHERFGGTDEGRLRQIHAAAADPDVQILLALRGGYGMSRILPALDFSMLAASGKLFVGHSDFTALQMGLLAQQGAASFAGPMVCDDFTREEASAYTLQRFWQCVSQPAHQIAFQADGNPALDVSGILWGGNLTMLTHLAGTPYMPRIEGGILFVEDVNEHPYRVERMLLQLLHAGLLRQKALVLGDFSNYRLSAYDNGYDFAAMLAYLRAHLPVPVLTGLPFGHIRDKATLVVGCQGRLQSDGRDVLLSMSGYPSLGSPG